MTAIHYIQNIPFFSIFLAMFGGIVTPLFGNGKNGTKSESDNCNIDWYIIGNVTGISLAKAREFYIYDGAFSCALGK